MKFSDVVAAVGRGEELTKGGAPDRPCAVNGTRTRARLGDVPVCQGCWAQALSAAREQLGPVCRACGERSPSVSIRADDRIVCDACDARTWAPKPAATVARLPCAEFPRFLRAVLGRPVETGTAIAKRVRHPGSFDIEHEAPCRAFVRYTSDQARIELTSVLRSYQLAMPLRVTPLRHEGRRALLVEVAA
jgi:hypothetical protein